MATQQNKVWTDDEKLDLADKFEEKLRKFLDNLDSRFFHGNLNERRWQDEIEKHPLFKKKSNAGLRYDPLKHSKDEMALKYKNDGNFYMKHKKFCMAVCIFTEGIKAKCASREVQAVLFNNRSAAHYFMENYRSALSDALHALNLKPGYIKSLKRAIKCAFHALEFELCAKLYMELSKRGEVDAEILQIAWKLQIQNYIKMRVTVAMGEMCGDICERSKKLLAIIKQRGIKIEGVKLNKLTMSDLEPTQEEFKGQGVHLGLDETSLVWPVVFHYPQISAVTFAPHVNEGMVMKNYVSKMQEHGHVLLKYYHPGKLNVYYGQGLCGRLHKVNADKTIKEITSENHFYVTGGTLDFFLLPANTDAEKGYIAMREVMHHFFH